MDQQTIIWRVTCRACGASVVSHDAVAIELFYAGHRRGGAPGERPCDRSTGGREPLPLVDGYRSEVVGFQSMLWTEDDLRDLHRLEDDVIETIRERMGW